MCRRACAHMCVRGGGGGGGVFLCVCLCSQGSPCVSVRLCTSPSLRVSVHVSGVCLCVLCGCARAVCGVQCAVCGARYSVRVAWCAVCGVYGTDMSAAARAPYLKNWHRLWRGFQEGYNGVRKRTADKRHFADHGK